MTVVELLIRNHEVSGKMYKYFYRLLKSELLVNSGVEKMVLIQSYGIEIERHDVVNDSLVNIERDVVYNISPNRYKVHNILKFLFENQVSPIHLVDIAGMETDENVFDYNDNLAVSTEV